MSVRATAASSIAGFTPSGLVIKGVSNDTTQLTIHDFFGTTSGASSPVGDVTTLSLEGLCGIGPSVSLDLFKYAGQIDFDIITPLATLTGAMYSGKFRLGQLFGETSVVSPNRGVTVPQLIRASDSISTYNNTFSLSSALVNDYVHTKFNRASTLVTDYSFQDSFFNSLLGDEIVQYVILQTPALSISDGSEQIDYTLMAEMHFNLSIMASPANLLLYRTFESIAKHKQRNEFDFAYDGQRGDQPPRNHDEEVDFIYGLDDAHILEFHRGEPQGIVLMEAESNDLSDLIYSHGECIKDRTLHDLRDLLPHGTLTFEIPAVETTITALQIGKNCIETGRVPKQAKKIRKELEESKKLPPRQPKKKKEVTWENNVIYKQGDLNFNKMSAEKLSREMTTEDLRNMTQALRNRLPKKFIEELLSHVD